MRDELQPVDENCGNAITYYFYLCVYIIFLVFNVSVIPSLLYNLTQVYVYYIWFVALCVFYFYYIIQTHYCMIVQEIQWIHGQFLH